jgi:RNA polymerase sigma factor (sigma-70 family)
MQTTFLRFFEHIGSLREPSSVSAWLPTTARRESLRAFNDVKREQPTEESELTAQLDAPTIESRFDNLEQHAALAQVLEELPKRESRLLRMLFADSAPSYAEITAALDMPIGSIGPTRARCLARLRADSALAY